MERLVQQEVKAVIRCVQFVLIDGAQHGRNKLQCPPPVIVNFESVISSVLSNLGQLFCCVMFANNGQWRIITFICSQLQINQQVSTRGDSIEVKENRRKTLYLMWAPLQFEGYLHFLVLLCFFHVGDFFFFLLTCLERTL